MTTDNKELAALVAEVREIAGTLADPMEGNSITRSAGRRLQQIAAALTATPSAQAGEVFGGAVIDLGDTGQLLNATVRGDVCIHAKFGYQVNGCCFIGRSVTDQRGISLTTPRTDEPARPEKALRDALEYVGQRSDGDLATIAERAELWMRESKVLIDHRREPAPTVDGGAVAWMFDGVGADGRPFHTVHRCNAIADYRCLDRNVKTTPLYTHPAPAPDGGAVKLHCPGCGKETRITRGAGGTKYAAPCMDCMQWRSPFRPAPAPDVARLVEADMEFDAARKKLESTLSGWVSPAKKNTIYQRMENAERRRAEALAHFTAAQPKEEG